MSKGIRRRKKSSKEIWKSRQLDEWENTPLEPESGYDDMSMRELKLLITQLTRMLQDEQRRSGAKDAEIASLLGLLSNAERDNAVLREDIAGLHDRIQSLIDSREADRLDMSRLRLCIEELQKRLVDAVNRSRSDRGARFGSQSQKGTGRKAPDKNRDMDGSDKPDDNSGSSCGGKRESALEEKEAMSDRESVELLPETEFNDGEGNPEQPKAKIPRPSRYGCSERLHHQL